VQQLFAVGSEFNQDFTTILIAVPAPYSAVFHQAVHQLHRAVMTKAKSLGKCCDGGTSSLRQAFDRKQELVLLGLYGAGSGSFFAEVQELTDAVPEFSELPVTRSRNISARCFRAKILAAESHRNNLPFKSYHDRKCCAGSMTHVAHRYNMGSIGTDRTLARGNPGRQLASVNHLSPRR
jgi:hypothetical protein